MSEPDKQPVPLSPARRAVVWAALALLLLMFLTAWFGDIFVWAIYGTKFILSPRFHQAEGWLGSFSLIPFLGFIAFEGGAEHFKQRRWRPFLLGVLTFIIATMPFARPCALLVRFVTVKGTIVLAQPKFTLLAVFLLLVFACKCRAALILWRLVRTSSKPRETRRIVVSE